MNSAHITEPQAVELVSALVLAQTGWNDDTIDATIDQIRRKWTSLPAAVKAVQQVCDTWTGMGRPPWGVLQEAYKLAARAEIMEAPALVGSPSRPVSVKEGRQIAARAYAAECRRRDPHTDIHILSGFRTTEPNPAFLDKLLGT